MIDTVAKRQAQQAKRIHPQVDTARGTDTQVRRRGAVAERGSHLVTPTMSLWRERFASPLRRHAGVACAFMPTVTSANPLHCKLPRPHAGTHLPTCVWVRTATAPPPSCTAGHTHHPPIQSPHRPTCARMSCSLTSSDDSPSPTLASSPRCASSMVRAAPSTRPCRAHSCCCPAPLAASTCGQRCHPSTVAQRAMSRQVHKRSTTHEQPHAARCAVHQTPLV